VIPPTQRWKHFRRDEFACKGKDCCGGSNAISDDLIDLLEDLRDGVGFPLVVTSGYRCPLHNTRVSTTGEAGPHTTGLAADLGVDRERAVIVLQYALRMPFMGFGVNQKGSGRFIHLDIVPREPRTVWSY
jgi:zinc D-Ala-D-Ala carboxypeptidase